MTEIAQPLVTVIVPVYKVEPYLRRCIDSIISQTYHNLEIILVDDGSPDGCPEICDEYAKRDSRIKVIHKKNGGLSDARNVGLGSSSGKYVTFVDSDDWIDNDLIETVMSLQPFKVALYGCTVVSEQGENIDVISSASSVRTITFRDDPCAVEQLINSSLFGYAWNKIYEKASIGNIRFMEIPQREDLIFNMPIFMCKSVESAEIVQNCILKLCKAWNRWTPDSDRLLSYSIQINYMDKSVLLSFAGNTVDIEKVMSVLGTKLPEEQELPQWCDRLRNCINSYGKVNGQPKLTDLMRSDGTLHFERKMVPPEMIEKTDCGHKDVYATLKLKEEEYNIINNNNIQIAPMYKIKNSKCNKCGKPYFQCDCIKFIDDDVTEEIIDFEWLAMSWTLHHA